MPATAALADYVHDADDDSDSEVLTLCSLLEPWPESWWLLETAMLPEAAAVSVSILFWCFMKSVRSVDHLVTPFALVHNPSVLPQRRFSDAA